MVAIFNKLIDLLLFKVETPILVILIIAFAILGLVMALRK